MSHNARVWAKRQQLGDSSTKHMLKTYADWAAEDYTTWVSNDELVRDTEMNHKTIRSCTKRLVQLGYLRDCGRRMGDTRQIVVYQMTAPSGSIIVEARDRRTGQTETLSPPDLEAYEAFLKRKPTESGSVKDSQKRKATKNGRLPNTDGKPPKNGSKDSQIQPGRLPDLVGDRGIEELDCRERGEAPQNSLSNDDEKDENQIGGARIHPDWKPSESQVAFARSTQPSWDDARVVREGQKFRNHWLAMPGPKALKADWNAMWENWVLSDNPARATRTVANVAAADSAWWESDAGITAKGGALSVERFKDEPTMQYLLRVAKVAGKGPWIDYLLKRAPSFGTDWYQCVVAHLGEALLPVDFYAS